MEAALTNDNYYRGLSAAELDAAEAIESEIWELLSKGFTEPVAIQFVQTVMEIRKVMPNATVGGVFDTALSAGLSYVHARLVLKPNARSQALNTGPEKQVIG